MYRRSGSWIVAALCLACGSQVEPADAGVDALTSDSSDSGIDASTIDSPIDAGPPRCEDLEPSLPDLSTARWSTAFAPRGLSRLGDSTPRVYDAAFANGVLVVGGAFTHAGPIAVSNVATWQPDTGWRALGAGSPEPIFAVEIDSDGALYAATAASIGEPATIRRWDGSDWSTIGVADGPVNVLAIESGSGSVLAGGWFRSIDGTATESRLARWDGSGWTQIERLSVTTVEAILAEPERLCVGAGGVFDGSVECLTYADGLWEFHSVPSSSELRSEYPALVRDLARIPGAELVAVGGLVPGPVGSPGGVVRWTGEAWELVGAGLSGGRLLEVMSATIAADGSLYVAGDFDSIGGSLSMPAFGVAQFASGRWRSIGGVQGASYDAEAAVVAAGTGVIVGGTMTEAFEADLRTWHSVRSIARFDGIRWSPLEHPGAIARGPGPVFAIAVRGSCDPVVVGDFEVVEDTLVHRAGALRDDDTLEPVVTSGTLLGFVASAVSTDDGSVVVGGAFSLREAGSSVQAPIARSTATGWETIGAFDPSNHPTVMSMVLAGDGTIVVGGRFTLTAAPEIRNLARWDGTDWARIGARDFLDVTAVAIAGSEIYVAESITTTRSRIAHWDGTSWSDLGTMLDGAVSALVVHDGAVVAGGARLDGVDPIVRWSGIEWQALGPAARARVAIVTLENIGGTLLAGGVESDPSGSSTGVVWRWDGAEWHTLGGGVDGAVTSIVPTPRGLLLGGRFDIAGDVPSWGLARLE